MGSWLGPNFFCLTQIEDHKCQLFTVSEAHLALFRVKLFKSDELATKSSNIDGIKLVYCESTFKMDVLVTIYVDCTNSFHKFGLGFVG